MNGWKRCLTRLRANRDIIGQWLAGPGAEAGVRGFLPEGTYLSWLDFRLAGTGDDPADWLLGNALVKMSSGLHFGPGGAGFARLNFATTGGRPGGDPVPNSEGPRGNRARGTGAKNPAR